MGILSLPPPQPFALYEGDPSVYGASSITANTVYLTGVILYATTTFKGVRCGFGVGGAGHYDTGIYDATGANDGPGTLLGSAAATATSLTSATGVVTPLFQAGNLTLSPGRYWLAFWCDNATDTAYRAGAQTSAVGISLSGTNAGPLPALASSISSIVDQNRKYFLAAIKASGWS